MKSILVVVLGLGLAIASAQEFDNSCGMANWCQASQTCCSDSAVAGCCPYQDAVCCSDGVHCCPSSAPVCDVTSGMCRAPSASNLLSFVPMARRLPSFHSPDLLNAFMFPAVGANDAVVKDCGDGAYTAHFATPALSPEVPAKGKPLTLSGKAALSKAFQGGKYTITAKMAGAKVLSHSGNLCGKDSIPMPMGIGKIGYNGPSCPQDAGEVDVSLDVVVPTIAPSAKYTFILDTVDSAGSKLFCIEADFQL